MDFNLTLPISRAELHARIVEIDNAMAAIRAQIAASDLRRQARHQPLDPHWFHRAKTALRHLQHERAELHRAMTQLPHPKDALKDRVIEVLRERHDASSWSGIIDEAHRRCGGEEL